MANLISNIARNDLARAWLFEKGVFNCCEKPVYVPCLSFDALAQDRGDITRIECPDPFRYGEFIEVGAIPGEISRLTTTLTSRMTRDSLSDFRRLFNTACPFDLHLHFGLCERPTDFNAYDKVLVFEDVYITSFGTDPLVALQSGDRAEINETVDISIGRFYELVQLGYTEQGVAETANTGPLIDAVIADQPSCGIDCFNSSDGCQHVYTLDDTGLILWTDDGGTIWQTTTTSFAGTLVTGTVVGIDVLNGYLWAYNTEGEIRFREPDEVEDGTASRVVTGLDTTGVDQDAGITYGLVVGPAGYVGFVKSPDCGFDFEPSPVTTEDYVVVNIGTKGDACDFGLIGGTNGTLVYTDDGETFTLVTTMPAELAAATITAVLPRSKTNWIIGADDGTAWCTDDVGDTWTQLKLPVIPSTVTTLECCENHVVYMGTDVGFLRSIDGGCTWDEQPRGKVPFPTNTELLWVLCCEVDPNRVWTGGEDAGAGVIIYGTP